MKIIVILVIIVIIVIIVVAFMSGPTDESEIPDICPPGYVGHLPHVDDCSKFYLCLNGTAIEETCQSGYEFDPLLNTCTLISDHGCTAAQNRRTPRLL